MDGWVQILVLNEASRRMDDVIGLAPNGQYRLRLDISTEYWWDRIEENRRRTVEETNCQIEDVDGRFEISGPNIENVREAKTKILQRMKNIRNKLLATHIVTISAVTEETTRNFNNFEKRVLEITPIDEEAFCYPERAHWTLAKLVLLDEFERQRAVDHFEGLRHVVSAVLNGQELTATIRGVSCEGDSTQTKVLYAECDSPLLKNLQRATSTYMRELGYTIPQSLRPTTAVSLIKSDHLVKRMNQVKATRIDVHRIMESEDLRDFDFGTVKLHKIQLSETITPLTRGYYPSVSSINF